MAQNDMPKAVGGTVIEVSFCKSNAGAIYIRFVSSEDEYSPKVYGSVLVYRSIKAEGVEFGDSIWWLGKKVSWTPKQHNDKPEGKRGKRMGKDYDIKLERIGEVNVPHPDNMKEVTYPKQPSRKK